MNYFNHLLEAFDTKAEWQYRKGYDKTKKNESPSGDYYEGIEYLDEYLHREILPDKNELEITVGTAYYVPEDYGDLDYATDYINVYVNVFYGEERLDRNPKWEVLNKMTPEEKSKTVIKSQPYKTVGPEHEVIKQKRIKELEQKIEEFKKNPPNWMSSETVQERIKELEQMLSDTKARQPLAYYSHAKVANRVIGLVSNLLKNVCKKYRYVIFTFENQKHKEVMEKMMKKIAIKLNYYPIEIDKMDELNLKNDFDYIWSDNNIVYINGENLEPEEKLEKKIGDLF